MKVTLLRRATQAFVIIMMLLAAYQFAAFASALRAGLPVEVASRPGVVEGFLPVAAIVALVGWVASGVFDAVHPAGLVVLVAALATAFFFRRGLCSWVCPIGALSEALGALGRKLAGRNFAPPRMLDRALLALKFGLAAWVFKLFFLMPGDQALSFMRSPYYAVSDLKMFDFFASIGVFGIAFIAVLAVLSSVIKAFWCRYLCPYGALLGVLGAIAPVALKRDDRLCVHCHACNRACPNAVDVEGGRELVVTTECTGCGACVEACPRRGALDFRLLGRWRVAAPLLGGLFVAVFFGAILAAKLTGHWQTSLTVEQYRFFDSLMR